MSAWLQFQCGGQQFLLAASEVLSIEDGLRARLDSVTGHVAWRDHQLPLLRLAEQLDGAQSSKPQHIVVGVEEQHRCVLEVDQVEALIDLEDTDFSPLAVMHPSLQALVDAVHSNRENNQDNCQLRLRLPVDQALFATGGAHD